MQLLSYHFTFDPVLLWPYCYSFHQTAIKVHMYHELNNTAQHVIIIVLEKVLVGLFTQFFNETYIALVAITLSNYNWPIYFETGRTIMLYVHQLLHIRILL